MDNLIAFLDHYNSIIMLVILPILHYVRGLYLEHRAILTQLLEYKKEVVDDIRDLNERLDNVDTTVLKILQELNNDSTKIIKK